MIRMWHAALAALVAFALVVQIVLAVDKDRSLVNFFSYFTIQSNVLVLVVAVLITQRPDRDSTGFQVLRLAALCGITVTGLVYATILAGTANFSGIEWRTDKIFHYVSPVMAVVGFLAFRPRTHFSRRAYWFIVWPMAWLVYTLVRAEVAKPVFEIGTDKTAPVPYDFLDVSANGALSVTIAALLVTVLMLGLAWAYARFGQRDAVAVA